MLLYSVCVGMDLEHFTNVHVYTSVHSTCLMHGEVLRAAVCLARLWNPQRCMKFPMTHGREGIFFWTESIK